jgi:glycosyltransferase involved in cell wall biosynthesis
MRDARIVHLTSVHPRNDIRVFEKMCRSLVSAGLDVHLVVADGLGSADRDGVVIHDVGKPRNRAQRILLTPLHLRRRALELNPELIHLHDPELLPVGISMARRSKRVIFDSHEDVPKQLASKHYLPPILRPPLALGWGLVERHAVPRIAGVVAATNGIHSRLSRFNSKSEVVRNYPLLREFPPPRSLRSGRPTICYLGALTAERGLVELVEAVARCASRPRLILAGRFTEPGLRDRLQKLPGWAVVEELGQCDRARIAMVLEQSWIGMVTLHPTPNHVDSLPTKMYEYMAAGLPVIASDFPAWRATVSDHSCGIAVDPTDVSAVASAIDSLCADHALRAHFGNNGRRAIEQSLNWESESQRLLRFYESVLRDDPPATDAPDAATTPRSS